MTTAAPVDVDLDLDHSGMTTAPPAHTCVSSRRPTDLALIVRRLAAHRDNWTPLVRFDPIRRSSMLLDATSDYQAWLLTWLPGQSTDLHDHGDSAGAFTVVTGVLTELTVVPGRSEPLRPTALASPTAFATGQVRSFGPAHVHDISNTANAPAVSIHVYAPALEFIRRYALDPHAGLVEIGRERAGVDW
ncbi:cysteine dioxygenase family protein [Frankia sp. Cas4]|uniref:cysteine dioxygenase n=1 Tax=Frankia sp. Cas4 TaxID=3073927 RepID=UPI002AD5B262|nr:cysteine dioxygenase family protein [Frankia sp. Cas4]